MRHRVKEVPLYCEMHRVVGHETMDCPDFWEAGRKVAGGGVGGGAGGVEQQRQEAHDGQVSYHVPTRKRNE